MINFYRIAMINQLTVKPIFSLVSALSTRKISETLMSALLAPSAKIGWQFQKVGAEKLNKGQIQGVLHLYDKAIKYQPNLKNKIAMQCKTTGLQYLEKNKLEEAVKPLKAAAAYQPQLSEEIAKIFFDKANAMINGTTQNKHSENSETHIISQYFFE